ncbi:MAG: YafY family transcriptional regulator [Chloroflexi bacterium]|nr:YafY family transcriptional regulator [Chloroflexota bacterium]
MNRLDRLFAILLHLQNKRRIRAKDLAEKFEVSKRTIYRDLAALNQSGVPLYAQPGDGYTLIEGFYLPPLVFTPKEASALFLGTQMLIRQADGLLISNAKRALEKIQVSLPPETLQTVKQLSEIIDFITPQATFNLDDARLVTLQQAILERHTIHLVYHGYNKDEETERIVEPYRLFYSNGNWYFNGFCRLRQEMREFRLDRAIELRILDENFEERSLPDNPSEQIEVYILFKPPVLRWVHEQQHYGFVSEEEKGNGVEMHYIVHDLREIIPWLLGWGASAEPLSPLELRTRIREESQKIVSLLT